MIEILWLPEQDSNLQPSGRSLEETTVSPCDWTSGDIRVRLDGVEPQSEFDITVETLRKLPASDQKLLVDLIRGMAERAGIPIADAATAERRPPIEYLDLWLTKVTAERFSERTIRAYQWAITRILANDPVPTTQSIREYIARRLASGISANHVGLERKALKSFFDYLHEEGLWPTNPMSAIKPIPVKFRQPPLPSEESVRRLLTATFYRKEDQARFQLMMAILLDTGLRANEAVTILKSKIDMSRPSIAVVGKGDKERTVPISITTAAMIGEYLAAYDRPDNPYLFPSVIKKGRHWSVDNMEKAMRRACKRLGIEHIHPHQLRHFYATAMLKNGAKLEVVSRLLGHASVGITGDLYRHVDADEMDETHRKHGPLNGLNGEA